MDLVSKYRLIGAVIWLGLLVIIVPSWYSHPVNFVPNGVAQVEAKSTLPLVEHAYRLPNSKDVPLTDGQQANLKSLSKPMVTGEKTTNKQADDVVNTNIKTSKAVADKVSQSGKWIVRLLTYKDQIQANDLLGRLDVDGYQVDIKYFEKSKVYSVRTGPYNSLAKAEKDKRKLDKMLRIKSEVVQLP